MVMWRIRLNFSDDPLSKARLNEVLSRHQVTALRLSPRAGTDAELVADVVLALAGDDELGRPMLTDTIRSRSTLPRRVPLAVRLARLPARELWPLAATPGAPR